MIRLGLRLAFRGGRGSLGRLVLMAAAIGVGVAFVVAAGIYALGQQQRSDRVRAREFPAGSSGEARLLWSVQELAAPGAPRVTSIAVAPLTDEPPSPPGTRAVPEPGTVLVSPALARRLAAGGDLAGSGRVVGTLGRAALRDPDELVMMTGWREAGLRAVDPGARPIRGFEHDVIDRPPADSVWRALALTPLVVVAGAILLLPILVLVGAGARVGTRRREERLAALRLAGATPGEVRVLAAVEAATAGIVGVVFGLGLALVAREITVARGGFFRSDLVAPWSWVVVVALAAPLLAAASAALALRRVSISPLGVARRTRSGPVRARRAWVLGGGWIAFTGGVLLERVLGLASPAGVVTALGIATIVVGLMIAGPWCVAALAGLLARITSGARGLLAARRLAADPRGASRPVTAATLSLFVAAMLLVVLPSRDARDRGDKPTSRISPDLTVTSSSSYTLAGSGAAGPSNELARDVARVDGVRAVVPLVDAAASGLGSLPVALASCEEYARVTRTRVRACRAGSPILPSLSGERIDFQLADGTSLPFSVPTGAGWLDTAIGFLPVALVPPEVAPPEVVARGRLAGMLIATDGSIRTARRVGALLPERAPGMDLVVGAPPPALDFSWTYSGPSGGVLLGYVLLFAVSALVVTTIDGIAERRRALAALRAVGASPSVLRGTTMLEVAIPVGVAAVFGALSGLLVGAGLVARDGISLVVPWADVAGLVALIVVMWLAVTAVALPAVTRAASLRNLRTT